MYISEAIASLVVYYNAGDFYKYYNSLKAAR